jgi:hypothetical protein
MCIWDVPSDASRLRSESAPNVLCSASVRLQNVAKAAISVAKAALAPGGTLGTGASHAYNCALVPSIADGTGNCLVAFATVAPPRHIRRRIGKQIYNRPPGLRCPRPPLVVRSTRCGPRPTSHRLPSNLFCPTRRFH